MAYPNLTGNCRLVISNGIATLDGVESIRGDITGVPLRHEIGPFSRGKVGEKISHFKRILWKL